jgi:hypothetical protein
MQVKIHKRADYYRSKPKTTTSGGNKENGHFYSICRIKELLEIIKINLFFKKSLKKMNAYFN